MTRFFALPPLAAVLLLLAAMTPRPAAAADPIIVLEHFTNFR
jgi:hypothetical protein